MRKLIPALAAIVFSASTASALEPKGVHVTPPLVPHPMPQGVPYLVVGAEAQPVYELRYGVINGRRVLLNGRTMEVVYILHP